MKKQLISIALLSLAIIVAGCDKDKTASQQIETLKTETKDAAQDMKDYTFAQKTEFVANMQVQIDAINKDMDELETKIAKSSDAVKAEAKPKLQALREQTAALNKQLDAAKDATESTWDSVKGGFKKAYQSTKDGFNSARHWVSDKIAP